MSSSADITLRAAILSACFCVLSTPNIFCRLRACRLHPNYCFEGKSPQVELKPPPRSPPAFTFRFCLWAHFSADLCGCLDSSLGLCWGQQKKKAKAWESERWRQRLDQLGAVSHLITRCKWNGYTCLIFSGSRNVRLAQDGIKQHCQRKWTRGFLSYFTSYWVTVTIYFTAVGRLVWKCSVMPFRKESESRKKCKRYCSAGAFLKNILFVSQLRDKAWLFYHKAAQLITVSSQTLVPAFRSDWFVQSRMIQYKRGN